MTTTAGHLEQTDSALVWEQLTERLDALIAAWQAGGDPPELAEFLPEGPAAVRRMTLVEAIKIDLEQRWPQPEWRRRVEDYVRQFPELDDDGGIPCDVIYEEFHIRRRTEEVDPAEYYTRFPAQATQLQRLLKLEQPELTTTLVRSEPVKPIEVGQKLDDFELLRALGKGAFATVYLARQTSMQRLVALKVSSDRGFEPQTLAQLDHPHIVRVYDQRQLADRQMRLLYMQYVPGGTLQGVVTQARLQPPEARSGKTLLAAIDANLIRAGESPPADSLGRYRLSRATWPEAVIWIGARLASALHYAHERGVLHRDVKPANVLVSAEGSPKLADFNISFSKLDGATPAAYFGGSLAYMSPEQLEACDPAHDRQPDELDGRSDVYSLAVLLWEMLTGRRPFPEDRLPPNWGQALAQMAEMRRAGLPAEARAQLPPNCPPGLADVLSRCLAPDPADRYPNAARAAQEIELCLQQRARRLLHGSDSWFAIARRQPVLATICCGLLPNMVMCGLNIAYNHYQMIKRLIDNDPAAEPAFWQAVGVINTVSYAIGLGVVLWVARRAFRAAQQLAAGRPAVPPVDGRTIDRCLHIGDLAAATAASLWIVSGPLFPAWIELAVGPSAGVSGETYLHFAISDALSGLIAATQSFYITTFLAIRLCYPPLLQAEPVEAGEVQRLAALAWRSRVYFAVAVAVPFVAVTAAAFMRDDRQPIMVLSCVGLVGFALAYFFDVALRGDISALAGVIQPSGDMLGSGDSLDSFLTGSRK